MFKIKIARRATAALMLASAAIVPAHAEHHGTIADAVANTARPATDVKRDGDRKPADVLAFTGLKKGMTVLDVNSGEGYYSELLSYVVGDTGKVYAHNGPLYYNFVKNRLDARYNNRLPNVIKLNGGTENMDVAEGSVDLVINVLAFHDYYYMPKGQKINIDVPEVLTSIYKALKKDGALVIVDHVAADGTGSTGGNTTHRIEPAFVKSIVMKAGFKLVAESKVLANADDDLSLDVFQPTTRGKTDRFIYKFVK